MPETRRIPLEERDIDNKWEKKLEIYSQEYAWSDGFKPPSSYYVTNGWGDSVFIRTNKRANAQKIADEIWGKNHFRVKRVLRASVS